MSKLDKEIKPSNAQPSKCKFARSTLDESNRKSFEITPHGACKKLNNNRPQAPSNKQYLISEATTYDSVLSRRETSMTKFEEKSSDGVPRDFLHSMAQNTFDNLERVTEASHLQVKTNNLEPSTNTPFEENVNSTPPDDVSETFQNTSTQKNPGMQIVHLAACTDEIAEENSEAELDDLEKLHYKMQEETYTDSDQKSSSTRDDSAAYLTSETSTTKFKNKASDAAQMGFPHSMGQKTSNNPECLTKASFVEAINNNFAQPANTSLEENVKDITHDGVLKTSQNTSTRDTSKNSKSFAETSHPGMQTVHLAVCTDKITEEKFEAELDNLERLCYKMLEETNTDSDPKSSSTRDDSAAYLTSDLSTTKFENKASDAAHRDLLHSNGQNTSNHPECLRKASFVEAINNNFAPSTHTSVHENFKDITSDDVLKTSQHTSTRDTLENSKSSAETSHPGMQTVHLAVCSDEIAEEKFEAELDNLEKLRYKTPEETNTDSDPKSSSTRDDSAANLTSDTSTTKFENKALDGTQRDLPHSMGQNTSNNPECLRKALFVEAIKNNFAPPANTSVGVNFKDITSDDVLKTSQHTSTRDTIENSKSSAETSHPGMQTVQLAVCTDEIAEEKSEAELNSLEKLRYKMPEETNTDSDPKSSLTRDDSAAYLTSDTSTTKFENKTSDTAHRDLLHSNGQNTSSNNPECLTKASLVEAINNNFVPSTHTSVHENFKDITSDDVLKSSQHTSTRDTIENSKSSAETFHPGMQTVQLAVCTDEIAERKKFEAELDNLEKMQYKLTEETNTDSDPKSSSTRDDSAAYLTSETSTTKFENKASNAAQRDLPHSMGQNTFNKAECLTKASHVGAINNNFAPPANTSLEENVKDITSDDVLKISQNKSTRDPSENSKSSAETSHPGMQTVHSAVCTAEIAEQKSEAELDDLQKLSYKLTEETNTDSDPKSSSTRDDSAAYLTSDTSTTKFENKASDAAQRDLPHSMGQNTSNNPECLTKASHVETINNNFAPSTHTSVDENVKDIPVNVLKTSQNTLIGDTLENSKSSAETSNSGMQTVHSAVCTDEIEEKSMEKLDHLNENQDDVLEETYYDLNSKSKQSSQDIREPSEIIPHDLKHNIPEAMTHDNYVVDDDKIKPSGTTDNTYIENFAKKSIRTTKEGSLNGFLIITAVLMLVQSLTAVIIYVILTYNMKQQYDELEITLFNRLTGDHNKMSILLNKDGTDAKEPLDEKRIKQIEKEIEITRNYTKHILEPRIREEDEKIIKILKDLQSQVQGRLNELQVQINTLRNYYKALEGKDLKMENIILSIEEFVRKEIYDISLYIVVLLFVAVIVVFRVVYDKLKPKQLRAADSTCTVPADVSNGQSLMSGPKQKFSKVDQFSSDLIKKLLQKSKEKGVGIVSFNLSTQENHWRCFKALDIPSSLSVKAYVILKLDDLMLVQPYMQMVIFIDSNERNIILENSETEIGDIRRRTTEVLLEVGCNVFVVYYSDKNSKSLPKENLYNTSLYSINNHTVLSRLRSRGRVFSVYDTFHPQQVQMLKNCLT